MKKILKTTILGLAFAAMSHASLAVAADAASVNTAARQKLCLRPAQ